MLLSKYSFLFQEQNRTNALELMIELPPPVGMGLYSALEHYRCPSVHHAHSILYVNDCSVDTQAQCPSALVHKHWNVPDLSKSLFFLSKPTTVFLRLYWD